MGGLLEAAEGGAASEHARGLAPWLGMSPLNNGAHQGRLTMASHDQPRKPHTLPCTWRREALSWEGKGEAPPPPWVRRELLLHT